MDDAVSNIGHGLPKWKCHKEVWAAKIKRLTPHSDGSIAMLLDGGHIEAADVAWGIKFNPHVGDYLIVYADGYRSISPAKAFEDGYTLA